MPTASKRSRKYRKGCSSMMGKWDDWKNRNDPQVNDDVCPKCRVAMNSVDGVPYCPSCEPRNWYPFGVE